MLVRINHQPPELIPHEVHDAEGSTTGQSPCQEIHCKVVKGCVISFLGIYSAPKEPIQTIVAWLKSASISFPCQNMIKE